SPSGAAASLARILSSSGGVRYSTSCLLNSVARKYCVLIRLSPFNALSPGPRFSEASRAKPTWARLGTEHDAPCVSWRASVQLPLAVVFDGNAALKLHEGGKRPRESRCVVEVYGSAVSERLCDSG